MLASWLTEREEGGKWRVAHVEVLKTHLLKSRREFPFLYAWDARL